MDDRLKIEKYCDGFGSSFDMEMAMLEAQTPEDGERPKLVCVTVTKHSVIYVVDADSAIGKIRLVLIFAK